MKQQYSKTAPLVRLAFAAAALSVSLSIGGWIDFLATGFAAYAGADHRVVLTAEQKH